MQKVFYICIVNKTETVWTTTQTDKDITQVGSCNVSLDGVRVVAHTRKAFFISTMETIIKNVNLAPKWRTLIQTELNKRRAVQLTLF